MLLLVLAFSFVALFIYLWLVNRAVSVPPAEALSLTQKRWTPEQIAEAYRKAQTSPPDVVPYLFSKKNRRYIVTGGSGLVGGSVVQHLLLRGENPRAIRILDRRPPTSKEVVQLKVNFVQTDVSDADAVSKAVNAPWPGSIGSLPLTVFHCAAYISPAGRHKEFLPVYLKINVNGTENLLKAAQAAGASCFVMTSSASVGLHAPTYFHWPWQSRSTTKTWQFIPNAEPTFEPPQGDDIYPYGCCYTVTKYKAEQLVRQAHDKAANFLTGAIRPGHAIYGVGSENPSNLVWDYLRRGGSPSWLKNVIVNWVDSGNVSIGHLAYEDTLLREPDKGGRGYCVTDPNPPIMYEDAYRALTQLAHPTTPVAFPYLPHMVILLPSYLVEAYSLLRQRYPTLASLFPPVGGAFEFVQPAVSNMCALSMVYTDTAAQEELGYKAPICTLDGIARAVLEWNQKIEENAKARTQT